MEDLILMLDPNGKQEAVRPEDMGHYRRLGYTECEDKMSEPEQPDIEGTDDEVVEAVEIPGAEAAQSTEEP